MTIWRRILRTFGLAPYSQLRALALAYARAERERAASEFRLVAALVESRKLKAEKEGGKR